MVKPWLWADKKAGGDKPAQFIQWMNWAQFKVNMKLEISTARPLLSRYSDSKKTLASLHILQPKNIQAFFKLYFGLDQL